MCTGAAAPGQRSTSARTFLFKKRHGDIETLRKTRLQADSEPCCLWVSAEDSGYCRKLVDSPKASNDSALDYSVPSALLWLRCAQMDLTVLNVGRQGLLDVLPRTILT